MEKVNIVVEQELPDGKTYPVVAMTLGKYKREAVEMNVQNWSGDVSFNSNAKYCYSYSIPGVSIEHLGALHSILVAKTST